MRILTQTYIKAILYLFGFNGVWTTHLFIMITNRDAISKGVVQTPKSF